MTAPGSGTALMPDGLEGFSFTALVADTAPTNVFDLSDATLAGPAIFAQI